MTGVKGAVGLGGSAENDAVSNPMKNDPALSIKHWLVT